MSTEELRGTVAVEELPGRESARSASASDDSLGWAVLDLVQSAVAVLDGSGAMVRVNSQWTKHARKLGMPVEAGANFVDYCGSAAQEHRQHCAKVLAGIEAVKKGDAAPFVQEIAAQMEPEPNWFELRVKPLAASGGGVVITFLDITLRKRNELDSINRLNALARATRAVTIGALGGSLAHELNQPLTAILSNAQAGIRLLSNDSSAPSVASEILPDIVADARRAGEIIRRTRLLLKGSESERVPLDVSDVVRAALSMAADEALLRKVHIGIKLEPNLPSVDGDPVQLQQVLLNLVLNALDAMDGLLPDRCRLEVRTKRAVAGGVYIIVADWGRGIDKRLLSKIFGPFYTTKPTGMGMGLYIARAIVQSHGGTIVATPNGSQGVLVRVHLPVRA